MNWQYTYNVSQTLNDKVDLDRLTQTIQESVITIALDYIDVAGNIISLFFKAELSDDEEIALDEIIAAHTGEALAAAPTIVKAEILTEHMKYVEAGDTLIYFGAKTLVVDVSAGEATKKVDFKWPIPIALKSGTIGVSEEMIGDEMSIHIAPNTLVGAITQPLNIGDTSIYVSETVLQNVKRGYYVGLYQPGDDGVEIGGVISIDSTNGCLEIEPSSIEASAGSYLAMCIQISPYMYFHSLDTLEIGKQMPTAQRIPADTAIRIYYKNNNLVAKKASFFVEYLY